MTLKERLNSCVDKILKEGRCILCKHHEVAVAGAFTALNGVAQLIGQPKNHQRFAFYGLCRDCKDLPNLQKKVEEAIVNKMAPDRN